MPKRGKQLDRIKIVFWIPRILGILFCILLEIFVILSHGFSINTLIENVFVMSLLIALVLAWRWPLHGGIVYVLLGLAYFTQTAERDLMTLALTIPLIIAGVLFILDWEWRSKKK